MNTPIPIVIQRAIAAATDASTDDWREDDGFAENDATSRFIVAMEREFV